jgi:2-polyprenyl-3-methyl-5-hydroxy-6-metoxy-1,4-benzoquinol methylase
MLQEIRRRYQEFFHLFQLRPDQTILEIGTGGGFALEELKKVNSTFIPLDIPLGNLKKIRELESGATLPTCADAYQLPFRADSFDLIIMAEVVEHLQEPEKVMDEVFPLLKKDGKLLVSVPYKEKISYQICVHCHRVTPTHSHFHSFDENILTELLRTAGFKTIQTAKNCNKISNRLHFNLLTKKVPFPIWKLFDRFFNLLLDKPISLIALSEKV